MTADTSPEGFSLPIAWVGVEETPVLPVNQFIVQMDHDGQGVYLVSGLLTPPPVVGTPEEQVRALRELPFVAVNTQSRVSMTRARFEELRTLFNETAERWAQEEAAR